MAIEDQRQSLDQAFESIEDTILPGISMMLDTLLDAATLGRPGVDAETYAAELRTLTLQLEELTQQVEAISGAHPAPRDHRAASAA
jgi:hypothetical protein